MKTLDLARTRVLSKNTLSGVVAVGVSLQFGDGVVPTDHNCSARLSIASVQRSFFRRSFSVVSYAYNNSYTFLSARCKKIKKLLFLEE